MGKQVELLTAVNSHGMDNVSKKGVLPGVREAETNFAGAVVTSTSTVFSYKSGLWWQGWGGGEAHRAEAKQDPE